jgi:hypothetical protein
VSTDDHSEGNPDQPAEVPEQARTSVHGAWRPAFKEATSAFLGASVLVALAYTLFFSHIHPEFVPFIDRAAQSVVASGNDLIPVSVGASRKDGKNIVIEDFNGDEAILVLPRAFQAEDYPFIKVNLSGFTRYSKFKILWRQADNLENTHALELNRSGDEVTQIAMVYGGDNYRGQIADIALLFYDGPALGFENNNDVDIVIRSIEFLPFSAVRVAEQIFEDWTNPPLWQGYSNNIVRGIHKNGMVFPNAIANLLVVTGLAVAALIRWLRRLKNRPQLNHRLLATALCLCLYGWAFNDVLRWHWRVEQLIDTHERYAGLPLEERIRNNDIRCARFPEDCAAHLLPYF